MDGTVIAPLGLKDTHISLVNKNIKFEEFIGGNYLTTLGAEVIILHPNFEINFVFEGSNLYFLWLPWYGGIAGEKGYFSSEDDLIKDKNKLSKLLYGYFQNNSENSVHQRDVFNF